MSKNDVVEISFALHPAQLEIFFDQLTEPDSPHYNVGSYTKLFGELNKDAFIKSITGVPEFFDVFNFKLTDSESGEPRFRLSRQRLILQQVDFTQSVHPADDAFNWMQDRFNRPFKFQEDFLFETALLKISDREHWWYNRFHHILTDGVGISNYLKHVGKKYSMLTGNREIFISNPVDYKIQIDQDRKYLDSVAYLEDGRYWKAQFTALPPKMIAKIHSVESASGSQRLLIDVSEKIQSVIKSLSDKTNCSLQQLTIAALSFYFCRINSQVETVFGVPIHSRKNRIQRSVMGMFAGIIPLKIAYNKDDSASEFLKKVKLQQKTDYRHQRYPLSHLNRDLMLLKNGRRQLFDIVVNYIVFEVGLDFHLLKTETFELCSQHEKSPLHFWWRKYDEIKPLELIVEFQHSYFSVQEIQSLAEKVFFIFEQFDNNLNSPLDSIQIISETERNKIQYSFNKQRSSHRVEKTVTKIFEEISMNNPEKAALAFGRNVISYHELNLKANKIARGLIKNGFKKGDRVAIYASRSFEMIIAIVGILKAGGAYVPLNTSYPKERLKFIIDDGRIKYLLCSHLSEGIPEIEHMAEISEFLCDEFGSENIDHPHEQGSEIYVMYTSGSSGTPKGVSISEHSVLNLVFDPCEIEIHGSDKVLQWSNYAFDGSVYEIFGALLKGATLVLIDEEVVFDARMLSTFIDENEITIWFVTTALFNVFIENRVARIRSLRKLLFGGEMVSKNHVQAALTLLPRNTLIHVYGPTETTVFATFYPINNLRSDHVLPIGRPLDDTYLYILNKEHQIQPVGAVGELYIGGSGVARGYLNLPSLTSERFIADPFGTQEGGRLYKTGDLARWLPDGNIEYMGRIDDQVKIRGYRIELGEIENVAQQSGLVRQCVVVAREDVSGNKRLIGYAVGEGTLDKSGLISYLKEKLPDYMVPALWVELTSLPLTSNGKVDKKALPQADAGELLSGSYVGPRNESETKLCKIWSDLLGVERVGIHDNFFELGGHSLLAMRVVSSIKRVLGIDISVRDLFTHTTISELSSHLESIAGFSSLPPLSAVDRSKGLPLSFSQERLWFLDQLEGSVHYHIPAVLRLSGDLDSISLEHAFKTIVRRHEVLRTVLKAEEGQCYQYVQQMDNWSLEKVKVTDESRSGIEKTIEAYVSKPFDLSADSMLRVQLLELPSGDHLLVVVMHHIASDGWSISVMISELTELYACAREGRTPSLKPLTIQYGDYAVWQRQYLEGEVLDKKLLYWQEKLRGVSSINLPTDFPRPAIQSTRGSSVERKVNENLRSGLQRFNQQEETTMFMTLLSVFKVLLYRYSGQSDICVGSPIANRNHHELESLIGFFVNTLALRSEVNGSVSFREFLKGVKANTLDAYLHQDAPFEKVVSVVDNERNLSRSPLFQVMFALQNTTEADVALGGVRLQSEPFDRKTSQFDLTLNVTESKEGLQLRVDYCTDLYLRSTIERLLDHYVQLIESVLSEGDALLGELTLLSEAEQKQIVEEFNSTAADYPKEKTLVDLFESQVRESQHAVAVVYEGMQLSYDELNARSNQVAHYLRRSGVKEESLVAICLDRSLEMIVGILGILKAGGAYVPIDPEYPSERIKFMLEDTGASVVLTSAACADRLDSEGIRKVLLDSDWSQIRKESSENLSTNLQPTNLAYVIYTSGSTGRPKGVMIEHTSVVNLIVSQKKVLDLKENNKVLQFASIAFDASCYEIFNTILNGATLIIPSKQDILSVDRINAILLNENLDLVILPPSYQKIVKHENFCSRILISAGEPLSLDTAMWCKSANVNLINEYGPTEITVCATLTNTPLRPNNIVSIGKPIDNTSISIINSYGKLQPIGVVGELCIGGSGLARGYLNRSSLTKEKFVRDSNNNRIYKTGDLARWLPDGHIQYMGRIDDQLKIRGYRIELGEIERTLQESNLIAQTTLIVTEGSDGNKLIIAYVIPEKNYTRKNLRNYLESRLPNYMIPGIIIELESFPLTASGKVNKKTLMQYEQYSAITSNNIPLTSTETKLSQIWKKLLQIKEINTSDDFFSIGGHSLLAMRLVNAIKQEFPGLELSLLQLFKNRTISQFAHLIEGLKKSYAIKEQHILLLRQGKEDLNIFIVPGIQGISDDYYQLSESFDPKYNIYGIQMHGIVEGETPLETIEEIAVQNIDWIREIQADGPYNILGHSFGGIVTFEMIRRLESMGAPIGLSAILDIPFEEHISLERKLEQGIGCIRAFLRTYDVERFVISSWEDDFIKAKPVLTKEMFWNFFRQIIDGISVSEGDLKLAKRLFDLQIANLNISYKPAGKVRNTMLVIQPQIPTFKNTSADLGWAEYASTKTFKVPGNHYTMVMKPNCSVMIELISAEIT